jgi:DNA-binding beta-propeller fold protein YncE
MNKSLTVRANQCGAMLLALMVAALACGCASDGSHALLRFGVEDALQTRPVLWPSPPETPRYRYAGQLLGEQNFVQDQRGQTRSALADAFRWLVGLVSGESPPASLQRPQSGVVDGEGRIYVTDVSRQAVMVFDQPAGELVEWNKAEGLANFISPTGIALGPDGRILVADADLGIVAQLDREGNTGTAIGRGVLKRPTGIAYDPAGQRLYVADTYAHDIKVFDRQGVLLRTIGRRGEGEGELNFPTYLAFSKGELFVADTMNARVQVFSADTGAPRFKFGSRGLYLGNMVRPKGIALDRAGNIYVVESYYDHLLVFDSLGRFLLPIGGVGRDTGKFYLPSGAWTDGNDRIFVADTFNGRVSLFQFLGGATDGRN